MSSLKCIKLSSDSDPHIDDSDNLCSLNEKQKLAFDAILEGKNVAILGGGGTGKSYLISLIYSEINKYKKNKVKVQKCAMTGCAALLLGHGAKTIHSWSGVGLAKEESKDLYLKVCKNRKAKKNWLTTGLLIIDEISMMTCDLFEKMDYIGRKIRKSDAPFGGIQIVFVGDFYQLPPVVKAEASCGSGSGSGSGSKEENNIFIFQTELWKRSIHCVIELCEIFRQKDPVFHKILNEARIGKLSEESISILEGLKGRRYEDLKIRPTLIFPRKKEVDLINVANLSALKGVRKKFEATLGFDAKVSVNFNSKDPEFIYQLSLFDKNASYFKTLELVIGAQVMLIANIAPEFGLVNGSRGVVIGFCETTGCPNVEFINGIKKVISAYTWEIEGYDGVLRCQIPLQLAYAITGHKCQGATLDSALIDIGKGVFEYGQAYVMLSRVKSLDGLYIYDFHVDAFKVHPILEKGIL